MLFLFICLPPVSIRYDRGPAGPTTCPGIQALADEVGGGFAYT